MSEKTLKCYGMYIDAAEVVLNIPNGKMDELLKTYSLVGVYQDPDGQKQVLIYSSKEKVKLAYNLATSLGFTSVKICNTMIYVPESEVANKDVMSECEVDSGSDVDSGLDVDEIE